MSLYGFSYTICDFATNKNGKEIRSITKTFKKKRWIVRINDKFPPSFKRRQKKITDWITSQKPICRRHPINLNNFIKDISQKKDLPKSANDTIIYRLSLWYKQWKVEVAYSKMQHNSTLDALKLLNDIQNSHPMSQSCFIKRETHNASESKANKNNDHPVENQLS